MNKKIGLKKIWIALSIALITAISTGYAQVSERENFKKGQAYLQGGKYDEAIKEFTKVIEADPNNGPAYAGRGFAYAYKNYTYKALSDLNKAIEINPNVPDAYNARGVVYLNTGRSGEAISNFNKAIELNPSYSHAYNNRGVAYRDRGETDSALSEFNRAIALDPNYAGAYANRAVAYFIKKEYTKSQADVRKAKSLGFRVNPRFLNALNLATTLNGAGISYDDKTGIKFDKKGGVMGTVLFLALAVIIIAAFSIRIIQQYETGVVFQLGRYSRTLQPGLNFIIPVIEYARVIDMRISTNDIPKQQVITKDNVPVAINGVVYFKVIDAETAVIKVQNYLYAVSQYAQAALRDVVGGMTLDDLLAERQKIGDEIETVIQKEAQSWGLQVTAIKLQDVEMPEDLKKIMSRQASAEREKRATITKAEGDMMAAVNLAKAAETMAKSPGAMQLRTLQTIDGLGPSPSNTVVLAVPVDVLEVARGLNIKLAEKKPE